MRSTERRSTGARGPKSRERLVVRWVCQGSKPKTATFLGCRLKARKFHGVILKSEKEKSRLRRR